MAKRQDETYLKALRLAKEECRAALRAHNVDVRFSNGRYGFWLVDGFFTVDELARRKLARAYRRLYSAVRQNEMEARQ